MARSPTRPCRCPSRRPQSLSSTAACKIVERKMPLTHVAGTGHREHRERQPEGLGEPEHHDRTAPHGDREQDRPTLTPHVLRAARHHRRDERAHRGGRVEEPEHGRPLAQPVDDRREQRDWETKIIALRSARKTVCSVRFSLRKRKPSLIASQLTSLSSLEGGDGRMRAIWAITIRNVTASKTRPCGCDGREQDAGRDRTEHRVEGAEPGLERKSRGQHLVVEQSSGPRVERRPVERVHARRDEGEHAQRARASARRARRSPPSAPTSPRRSRAS